METMDQVENAPTDIIVELWGPIFSTLTALKSSLLQLKTTTATKDNSFHFYSAKTYSSEFQPDGITECPSLEQQLVDEWDQERPERSAGQCDASNNGSLERALDEEKAKVEELTLEIERLTTILHGQKLFVDQEDRLRLAQKEILRLEELNKEAADALLALRNDLVVERESNQALLHNNHTLLNALECTNVSIVESLETATDVEVQCDLELDSLQQELEERAMKVRREFQAQYDDQVKEFARIKAEKEEEINRLKGVDKRNAELSKLITKLRKDLAQRESFDSARKETHIPSFTELLINSARRGTPSRFYENNVYRSTSLNALTEPDIALETASIPTSRHSSISDMSNPSNFKYKDVTPTRQAELERRNKAQQPHLKSSYPVESTHRAWRHSPIDGQQGNYYKENVEPVDKVTKKAGLLKKLQSSLQSQKKSKALLESKENVQELVVKIPKVTEKPVAFTVDITPPGASKKSRKAPKKKSR